MEDKTLTHTEQSINAYIASLSGYDLDVYRDIFSSEYVYDVIYNHPERIKKIQPILNKMNFIQNTHFVLPLYSIIFGRSARKEIMLTAIN